MDDLEADWNEARKKKGSYNTFNSFNMLIFDPIFKTPQEVNLKISFSPIQIMESFPTSLKMIQMKLTSPNY